MLAGKEMNGKKLLRSVLFCPANNRKVLAKSSLLQADAFIYDLEDAVTASAKDTARSSLSEFFSRGLLPTHRTIAVRVNCPINTPWGVQDIEALAGCKVIDTLVIPKVETLESIEKTLLIAKFHRDPSIGPLGIWAMIETARGVLRAEVVASHHSVYALVFGSNDLTKDIRALHRADRSPILFSMSQCILAARAYKKCVLDGVYNDFKDDTGFAESCAAGRSYGFDGKTLIHPNQISVANEAYSPSPYDIEMAQKIIVAWEVAVAEGKTVAVVDGKMVEELHVSEAKEILDFTRMIRDR